jgi:predicted DNA-binding protein YlxM (UPF0122 family)
MNPDDLALAELGQRFGISRQRCQQIVRRAGVDAEPEDDPGIEPLMN